MRHIAGASVPSDERMAFYFEKAKEAQDCAAVAADPRARQSFIAASHSWIALAVDTQARFHRDWAACQRRA
jgi:hypothetical protein